MTGKELIYYIIQNKLEDEPVFKDGKFIGFKTDAEVAIEAEVGVWTVRAWIQQGVIPGYLFNDRYYIPVTYNGGTKA